MLVISNVDNCSFIGIASEEITNLLTTPGNYLKVKVDIKKDCCNTFSQEIDLGIGYDSKVSNDGEIILVSPEFFGLSSFSDSVFEVTVTITRTDSIVVEDTNCFFFDCDLKCQIFSSVEYRPDNEIVLLHYALTQGSNCGCNCETLCSLLQELKDILNIEGENCNVC